MPPVYFFRLNWVGCLFHCLTLAFLECKSSSTIMFRNAISVKLVVETYMGDATVLYNRKHILVSEKSTICNLDSDGTNFIPPSQKTEQLLQIDVKHVFDSYYILIYTYISLFKVDNNHNSLLTNKHRLKFFKNFNHVSYIYPTLAINVLQGLHVQPSPLHNFTFALKTSSNEESFIAMGTFCHN